jgi:hypothetical protein
LVGLGSARATGKDNKGEFVLSQSIGEWVSDALRSFQPSRAIAIQALRHLSKKKRVELFSKHKFIQRIAFGQLYEAAIYERLLELIGQNREYSIVSKGDDVWRKNRTRSRLGQDGLFYDVTGAIVARGNGQDIAEFDTLVLSNTSVALVEVKTSKKNLEELDLDIAYKRRLLEVLLSRQVVLVLVSCLEIGDEPVIGRVMNMPSSFLVITAPINGLRRFINSEDVSNLLHPGYGSRSTSLSKLETKKINYLPLHDQLREEVISVITNNREPDLKEDSWVIKRIVVGCLDEPSKEKLFNEKSIVVGKEKITMKRVSTPTRVILALRMPAFRPELYIKFKEKTVYLKLGPIDTSTFQFERNIRRKRTAFFDWLESELPNVKPELMDRILKKYLTDDIVGSRKKPGESPEI